MKKLVSVLMLMFMLMISTFAFASDGVKLAAGIDTSSKYVWRGIEKSSDWVLQPQASLGLGNFTLAVQGNYALDKNKLFSYQKQNFNELYFTLDHLSKYDKFIFNTGLTYYTFPNTTLDETAELYVGIGYDWYIIPMLKAYYDVNLSGIYLEGSLGKAVPITKWLDIVAKGTLGFAIGDVASERYLLSSDDFSDVRATLGLNLKPFSGKLGSLVFYPHIEYSQLLKDRNYTFDKENTFYGILIGYKF